MRIGHNQFRGTGGRLFRWTAWLLICAFFLPAPLSVSAAPTQGYRNDNPANAHIMRRLNSPERQALIDKMAEMDAAARAAAPATDPRSEEHPPAAPSPVVSPRSATGDTIVADTGETPVSAVPSQGREPVGEGTLPSGLTRPQSVSEVLFNYGTSFIGVPGLAPRQGPDGLRDEGLGFHQDGTARRAGGVTGASGPSDRGQRSRAYMQSGFQNGYSAGFGQPGYAPGLYDDPHYGLWRDDPTRGGRRDTNSREFGDFDPRNMAIDRGLSWGAGFANSLGEAALSGLVDGGRARFNFRLDRDGYVNGEGDALLPFYDGKFTTVYTQLGARSMHDSDDTRWIGNVGLGQRWFPLASGEDVKAADYDAGSVMLGYNAFFDYDFTRSHQRGGLGVEAQFDWLRLASNYYFPISDWKGSKDFDSRFVQERPAEGWDVRAKGYLPFYRNVAVTGAYSQWYGDHVGMFGASRLEKDPKVWSYGIEYTPVPLVSGFITQKSTERGRSATEFGLNFTYHFQMPWEDQITHGKVAELRTVGGSRHEFVDRENRIILEYRAKNAYRTEFLGQVGANTFRFRIRDGFDEFKAGQTVRVTADGVVLAAAPAEAGQGRSLLAAAGSAIVDFFTVSPAHAADFSQTYTTDRNGEFVVRVSSPRSGPLVLHVQAGDNTQSFTVNVVADSLSITTGSPLPDATINAAYSQSLAVSGGTAPYTFAVADGALPAGLNVTGSAVSGTPTAAGTFTFTVTVMDAFGAAASKEFTLTVNPAVVYSLEATPHILTLNTPQNVVFTVNQNGAAVGSGVSVTFDANAVFTALPTGTQTTDANGQITVAGLTATATGAQTITASIEGQTVSVAINVSSGAYSLEATPNSLTQGSPANVTFTVKQGGAPVPVNTPVTFDGNANFMELASPVNGATDNAGQITLSLTAITAGSQSISVTVGGQTVFVAINVIQGAYSLEASPNSLAQGSTASVTFTVKQGGFSLPVNTPVTFDGNANFMELGSQRTMNTDSAGQITIFLTPLTPGSQSIRATVFGQIVSVPLTVTPGTYSLEASAQTLIQGVSSGVTFTVKQGGLIVPVNTPVAFNANPGFAELAGGIVTQPTDAAGQITLTLTAAASGSQTVSATVNGQAVSATLTVDPSVYTLEAAPNNLDMHTPTSVTLTFKQGGHTVPANSPVTISENPVFMQLANPVTDSTDAWGRITQPLTAVTPGTQTILATVNGQAVSVTMSVAAGVHNLEVAPVTLTQGISTPVTFTLKLGGLNVAANTPVAFDANANFTELASPVTLYTNGSGQITVNLTATASGSQTISAVVGDQPVRAAVNVTPGAYSLEASPNALTQGSPALVTFTVKQGGSPVPANTPVTFDNNTGFTELTGQRIMVTDSAGRITLSLTAVTSGTRTVSASVNGQAVNVVLTVSP